MDALATLIDFKFVIIRQKSTQANNCQKTVVGDVGLFQNFVNQMQWQIFIQCRVIE